MRPHALAACLMTKPPIVLSSDPVTPLWTGETRRPRADLIEAVPLAWILSSPSRWDKKTQSWLEERPAACAPTGHAAPGPDGWNFKGGSPRTEVGCDNSHCMYTNLYYNRGRWCAWLAWERGRVGWGI